ncbi:MAG: LamG domain-containing protein [Elusimicrobiota bacterium]
MLNFSRRQKKKKHFKAIIGLFILIMVLTLMQISIIFADLWYGSDDPQAYYAFDTSTGDILDSSENGYDALGSEGITRGVDGKIADAFAFNGSGAWVNVTNIDTSSTEYSVSAWAKLNDTNSNLKQVMEYSGTDFHFSIRAKSGDFQAIFANTTDVYTLNGIVTDTNWHHFAFTSNENGDCKFYVDGNLNETLLCGDFDSPYADKQSIIGGGRNPVNFASEAWNGTIDEVGIWTRELSADDIDDLYNEGSGSAYGGGRETTLNSPENNAQILPSENTFNCSVNSPLGIENVSLYLNGSIYETNTSGINDIDYIFTPDLVVGDNQNWTCEAYDLDGNSDKPAERYFNVTRVNFNSLTYEKTILEGDKGVFEANISYDDPGNYVVSGTLIYNETEYSATKIQEDDYAIFQRNITIPGVEEETDIDFLWKMGLTDADGTTYFNSTENNQTIKILNMSETGHPETTPFINFTAYDETTLNEMNATFDATFIYRVKGGTVSNTFSYSDTSEENSSWSFALDPSDDTYVIDAVIEFGASGYSHKFYNFEGIEFNNETTEIGLYLLNASSSTSFIVSVRDESYVPLTGIEVYAQRYYPSDNSWRTTEISETNGDGRTIEHLFTEDTKYRFKLYEDGEHIYTSDATIIYCEETPCTVEIIIEEALEDILGDFEDLNNLETSLEYDSVPEEVSFEYSDTSGNFTSSRLHVIRADPGNTSVEAICNSTGSSSTAVLECDLNNAVNGTYIASGYITRNGEEHLVKRISFNKEISIPEKIGADGILWSIFFLVGILMLGLYRPSLAIVFGAVGVFLLRLLKLISIPITAVIAIVGIAIILLVEVKRQ